MGAAIPARAIRARGEQFEIITRNDARTVFLRGINLGAAPPGHFPGEFAISKADYVRWLRFARDLHANAIRVYALHPPEFYQALAEENASHPESPIWLLQEIWTELPEDHDFWNPAFTRGFEAEIRLTIDAIHGNAVVKPRPGHASGRYETDASPFLAGWILGREWEPYAVRVTEARHNNSGGPYSGRIPGFWGKHFAVDGGTAMEQWLGRICDTAVSYEKDHYGLARAVSFVNWPTLDPMRHPTEFERGGAEAEHDEDAYAVDPTRIRPLQPAGFESGFLGYFANYHVYPYYPDFMNLDPGYSAFRDRHGACNYAGYLADLKAHTRGIPLLIGEVGVPASRGIAHQQPQGIHHGGASEDEQGARDVRLLEDADDAGCAGALLFSLFDEWFKVNWLVERTEWPRDRDPLWHNLLDPEECYGLIGFDPPPAVRVDGATEDWAGIPPFARSETSPLRALYVTSDQARFYLRIDLAVGALSGQATKPRSDSGARGSPPPARLEPIRAIGVSLDVLDPDRGDRRLPAPLGALWSRGAEFVLLIEPGTRQGGPKGTRAPMGRAELFIDRQMNYSAYARLGGPGGLLPSRAPFQPVANEDGAYAPLLIETNRERVSRSGKLYPALNLDWGRLASGREPGPAPTWPGADSSLAYNPHGEWTLDDSGTTLEIAIPWGLLNVADPSSRCVVDDRPDTPATECTPTEGIGLLAWATTATGLAADSLGPTARTPAPRPAEAHFLGPEGTTQHIELNEVRVATPRAAAYSWSGWEKPITHERIKRSAIAVRQAFEGMDSREVPRNSGMDARDR